MPATQVLSLRADNRALLARQLLEGTLTPGAALRLDLKKGALVITAGK